MQAHQLVQAVRLQGREDAAEVDLLRRASQPGPPGAGADVQDARLLRALTVLRITTGLHPVERAIQSLVTFPSPPYS